MFQDFGISPEKFLIQTLIFLSLAILATVRVLKYRPNRPIAFWMIVIWLVPFLRPIFALLLVWPERRTGSFSQEP